MEMAETSRHKSASGFEAEEDENDEDLENFIDDIVKELDAADDGEDLALPDFKPDDLLRSVAAAIDHVPVSPTLSPTVPNTTTSAAGVVAATTAPVAVATSRSENEITAAQNNTTGVEESASSQDFQAEYQAKMACCENCNYIGLRDSFYATTKKFCSLKCSKSYSSNFKSINSDKGKTSHGSPIKGRPQKNGSSVRKNRNRSRSGGDSKFKDLKSPNSSSRLCTSRVVNGAGVSHRSHRPSGSLHAFDWRKEVINSGPLLRNSEAAPVSAFPHVAMAAFWKMISVGLKVEVSLRSSWPDEHEDSFWIATITKLAGYYALLRFEGYSGNNDKEVCFNLCKDRIYPVGWSASHGKNLVPPRDIINKYEDWGDVLTKRLTGARTLPMDFLDRIRNEKTCPLKAGMLVEVVDKKRISQMRVAQVERTIGGRLHLLYQDANNEDDFWCHHASPVIHYVGWSEFHGHNLAAAQDYKTHSMNVALSRRYSTNEATPSMFRPRLNSEASTAPRFKVGMKLEAVDPLNLSSISVATVRKVLRNNYLMIGIDGSSDPEGGDWFCYHASSACIFPAGFCAVNGLDLTPPRGFAREPFSWVDYLEKTGSSPAPVRLFQHPSPTHGLRPGMKLEAVDLMEPWLLCVASISRCVGRLLRIHFDGWDESFDQWVDSESPDIYPIGWSEVAGHALEGPRVTVPPVTLASAQSHCGIEGANGGGVPSHNLSSSSRISSTGTRGAFHSSLAGGASLENFPATAVNSFIGFDMMSTEPTASALTSTNVSAHSETTTTTTKKPKKIRTISTTSSTKPPGQRKKKNDASLTHKTAINNVNTTFKSNTSLVSASNDTSKPNLYTGGASSGVPMKFTIMAHPTGGSHSGTVLANSSSTSCGSELKSRLEQPSSFKGRNGVFSPPNMQTQPSANAGVSPSPHSETASTASSPTTGSSINGSEIMNFSGETTLTGAAAAAPGNRWFTGIVNNEGRMDTSRMWE